MASDFLQYLKKKKLRFGIIAGIFLFYHLLFNSFTGQILIDKILTSSLTGKAEVNVRSFSLFYGFRFSDLKLYPTTDWGQKPVVQIKELGISYNLPLLILGRLKISKIFIHGLELDLQQRGVNWNISSVFPPGEEKPPEELKEPLKEIRTYIPVSAYLGFELKDIRLKVRSENGAKSYSAGLEGLELEFLLDTNRFTKIPLDLAALDLIDELKIRLNPENQVKISFQDSSGGLDHPFRSTLIWEKLEGSKEGFHSRLDLGSEKIPIRVSNRVGAPFGFSFKYDLDVSPEKKELLLRNLEWKVGEDTWLEGSGKISDFAGDSGQVNLAIQKSKIRLTPLSDFLHSIGFNSISMSGEASLAPILAEGGWENLRILGEIRGNALDFRVGKKRHSIPVLNLDWDLRVNPQSENDPGPRVPFPWMKAFICKNLKVIYNDIQLEGGLQYSQAEGPNLNLKLDNFGLGDYLNGYSGKFSAELNAFGKDFSELGADLKLKAKAFRFPMARGNSGNIYLDGGLKAIFHFPKKAWGLEEILVSNLNLEARSSEGNLAAKLNTAGKIGLGETFVLDLKKAGLDLELEHLVPLLPLSLRETLIPVRNQVGKKIGLNGDFFYSIGNSGQNIQGSLGVDLPGMEMRDGKLSVDMKMLGSPSSKIQIDRLELTAFSKKLSLTTNGELLKAKKGDPPPSMGEFSPNLKGELKLLSPTESGLIKGLFFKGEAGMKFSWLGNSIQGNLISRNSNILLQSGICPGYDCKLYKIDGWNADVPFHHDLSVKETKNLIEGNKRKFVMNYGRTPAPNFTIRQIIGNHPSLKGTPFEYSRPKADSPGLSANLEYSENYLRMDYLKVYTLDGEIWGKDMIVNVGSGDPEKMEYSVSLRVKDIDLKQLLPAKTQPKIDDGKVKADLNLWGRNLGDPIPNLNLFFSIYQIGDDFGKSAINIFAPSNILTDFIYGSYAVDKIELELSKGLVYAVILFKRSVLSSILKLEDNQVSQQRMPLANFLKRAQNEIETFNQ
ncbi:LIC_11026 family protein [Leptospira sarikeiensis]|uniref:Uncharacterized protein n=1 Tax=Leptospira sarikeiensis TaxID=2484943 RepID=A0A4R9KGI5_9LEPT|nr:hypothetical protein [Leptospira sarikeiensis]TGL64507.1 hypothetical protein EHQ64_01285 [Leptospira sarikeiensis]